MKPMSEEIYFTEMAAVEQASKKKLVSFVLISCIICVIGGCGILYYKGPQINFVQIAVYFLLGMGFTFFTYKNWRSQSASGASLIFISAFGIAFLCCLFALLRMHLPVLRAVPYGAAFLLPIVVYQSWLQFVSIPKLQRPLYYFSKDQPFASGIAYVENIPVKIKIIGDGIEEFKFS